MKPVTSLVLGAAAAFMVAGADAQPPKQAATKIIYDTDMWGDIDDVLALAMLHALQDRGEVDLLAVTSSTDDPSSVSFIDAVDTFYGHGDIPVGVVRNGVTGIQTVARFPFLDGIDYVGYVAEKRKPDGSLVFPRSMADRPTPEAVSLLRKTLASQPDGSVVIVQVGFSTNLARLIESKADEISPLDGLDLVKRKVRLLSVMAGAFADKEGQSEFNLVLDVSSAQRLFAEWPTPIIASGVEIGASMLIKGSSVDRLYGYAKDHPVSAAYYSADKIYRSKQTPQNVLHDHATFDLTSVLYAARPDDGYFSFSNPGKIAVLPDGSARFDESANGKHRYMIMNDAQRSRALEAMILLASQPPLTRSETGPEK